MATQLGCKHNMYKYKKQTGYWNKSAINKSDGFVCLNFPSLRCVIAAWQPRGI